jgi:hypothetical protein
LIEKYNLFSVYKKITKILEDNSLDFINILKLDDFLISLDKNGSITLNIKPPENKLGN